MLANENRGCWSASVDVHKKLALRRCRNVRIMYWNNIHFCGIRWVIVGRRKDYTDATSLVQTTNDQVEMPDKCNFWAGIRVVGKKQYQAVFLMLSSLFLTS